MNIERIPPTVEKDPHGHGNKITHPAFAQISANRIHGGHTHLYGSDFAHNGVVRITIYKSELGRDLSHDWPFAGREYIAVDLSEAQWATFVSSMNIGHGAQCTLVHRDGHRVPGIEPIPVEQQFRDEADHAADRAVEAIEKALAEIGELKLTKKQQGVIEGALNSARNALTSSLPFVKESFAKHAEKTVERAKMEVHGYIQRVLSRAGIAALNGGEAPIEIEDKRENRE